jgi:hypothetical protein
VTFFLTHFILGMKATLFSGTISRCTHRPENLCIAKLRSKMNYWLKISTVLFVEEIKENN